MYILILCTHNNTIRVWMVLSNNIITELSADKLNILYSTCYCCFYHYMHLNLK